MRSDYPTFAALGQKIFSKKVGHLTPFIFNEAQVIAWDTMAGRIAGGRTLFIVFLKARQFGISTLVTGFQHWQVWRLTDIECTMVGHERPLVQSFIDRLRVFHEELPKVPGMERNLREKGEKARVPKDELYYADMRSKVTTVIAKNVLGAIGRSAKHIMLSEFSAYDDALALLGNILPQLPPLGSSARLQCSVLVESTPRGKNDFYTLWQLAKDPDSEWVAKFMPWFIFEGDYSVTPPHGWKMDAGQKAFAKQCAHWRKDVDGKDFITPAQMYWYEQTLLNECGGDQDEMDRQYPSNDETCFLLHTKSIFKHEMRYLQATVVEAERDAPEQFAKRQMVCKGKFLRGMLDYTGFDNPFGTKQATNAQLRLNPEFKETPRGNLLVWSPPQVGHTYVIGIDSASGISDRDNSVACVIDVTVGKQVAEYAGIIPPEILADDCVALGWWYNCAVLYPEINSIGVVVMKRIKQVWMYPQLGREEKWDETGLKSNKYGHYTNSNNKKIMVSFIKYLVDNHFIGIASEALLAEMSIFVETGDDEFAADNDGHDDRVLALCLAAYVIRQSPRLLAELDTHAKNPIPLTSQVMLSDAPSSRDFRPGEAFPGVPEQLREQLKESNMAIVGNPIQSVLDSPLGFF